MAVCLGRTAESRSTGMLTSPKVIVPDHSERTRALELSCSCSASGASLRLRLGNFPLPGRGDARLQAIGKIRLRSLLLHTHRLDFLAARLGCDEFAQPLAILVLPLFGIEIRL